MVLPPLVRRWILDELERYEDANLPEPTFKELLLRCARTRPDLFADIPLKPALRLIQGGKK